MKKLSILLLIIFYSFYCYPQSASENQNLIDSSKTKLITNNYIPDEILRSKIKIIEAYNDVAGSPYIENYTGIKNNIPLGKVYDAKMNYIGTAFILYNAHTDEMEISAIEDSVSFYRLKKESNSFYIKLRDKLYRAYVSDYQMNYFIILSETDNKKCTLLKKEKVIFIKGSKQNVSLVKDEPSSFRRINDTYYLKIGNLLHKIPNKKKRFFALFKEKSDLIEVYFKKNRLKTTSEEDLINVTDYYNSINQ